MLDDLSNLFIWERRRFGKSVTPYIGNLATRCRIPSANTVGGEFSYFERSYHYARDNISSIGIGIANWYVSPGGNPEANSGATTTVTAAIEYPAETYHQLTFNGSTSLAIASGQTGWSDQIPVTIPMDEKFYVRVFRSGTAIPFVDPSNIQGGLIRDAAGGDVLDFGAGDVTMGGSATDDGGGYIAFPCAIVGPTTRPSIALIGDSRVQGATDVNTSGVGDLGEIARSIGPSFAYINMGIYGDMLVSFLLGNDRRLELCGKCSHVITELAINDIIALGTDTATIQSQMISLWSLAGIAGKPTFQNTLLPMAGSSDGYATIEGQTPLAHMDVRHAVNTWLRSGSAPITGINDICAILENDPITPDSKWKIHRSDDGAHENPQGYLDIANSGIFDLSRFHL